MFRQTSLYHEPFAYFKVFSEKLAVHFGTFLWERTTKTSHKQANGFLICTADKAFLNWFRFASSPIPTTFGLEFLSTFCFTFKHNLHFRLKWSPASHSNHKCSPDIKERCQFMSSIPNMTLIVMEKCLENKIILQTGLLVRHSSGTSAFLLAINAFIFLFLVYFRL